MMLNFLSITLTCGRSARIPWAILVKRPFYQSSFPFNLILNKGKSDILHSSPFSPPPSPATLSRPLSPTTFAAFGLTLLVIHLILNIRFANLSVKWRFHPLLVKNVSSFFLSKNSGNKFTVLYFLIFHFVLFMDLSSPV